jgi:hypothetical protein
VARPSPLDTAGQQRDLRRGQEQHLPAVDLGELYPETWVVADDPRPKRQRDNLVESPEGAPDGIGAGAGGGHGTDPRLDVEVLDGADRRRPPSVVHVAEDRVSVTA